MTTRLEYARNGVIRWIDVSIVLSLLVGIWREKPSIRDWLPTQVWSFCMDAICVGLLFLIGSSLYMGWQLKDQRKGYVVSLVLGVMVSSLFLWGLAASGM